MSRALLTATSFGASSLVLALSLRPHVADLGAVLFVALSFAIVLAAFAIVGSYDELMGRPREHAWALTLPASERTHYVARLANIGVLALVMSVSAALPIAGLVGLSHGAGLGLVAAALMLLGMAGASAAVLSALWGLTLAVPYRLLRPALSALRALLIGAIALGYQWVGMAEPAVAELPWWPAQWVLAAWAGEAGGLLPIGLTALGFAALFAFVFPGRYFALLRRIAEGESVEEARPRFGPAPTAAERLLVRAPASRAAFGMAAAALHGDRLVRGRVWPAAFLGFIFAGFCWWQGGLGDLLGAAPGSLLTEAALQLHLSAFVVLLFCAQSIAQALRASDHAEGAWVFEVLPLGSARPLWLGAQQAVLLRVLLPLHLALAVLLGLSMPPLHAALHAGFWLAASAVVTRVQVLLNRELPFSRRSDRFSLAERFVPLLLAVPVAVGFLLLQMVTFTAPLGAALLVLGLFALHGALGHLAPPRRRLAVPLPEPEADYVIT